MPLTATWLNNVPIISGAGRNTVNLNRSWQQNLDKLIAQECPFEPLNETEDPVIYSVHEGGEDWRILRNSTTPWTHISPDNFLIIPHTCWKKEELLRLGQETKLTAALFLACSLVRENAHQKFLVCIHVGQTAGQNVCHPYFHVLPLPARTHRRNSADILQTQIVHQSDPNFVVFCDGVRAGQCMIMPYILPTKKLGCVSWDHCLGYGRAIDGVLKLYGEVFTSEQGLPPDFTMSAVISQGIIQYATTIPILSQWGGPEYIAPFEGSPYSIPWDHETSARWLNKTNA